MQVSDDPFRQLPRTVDIREYIGRLLRELRLSRRLLTLIQTAEAQRNAAEGKAVARG